MYHLITGIITLILVILAVLTVKKEMHYKGNDHIVFVYAILLSSSAAILFTIVETVCGRLF